MTIHSHIARAGSHRRRHFNNTCDRTPDQYIGRPRNTQGTADRRREREAV